MAELENATRKTADKLPPQVAIQQAIARYCRGIDRLDREAILSAYWPDGYDDHLVFGGSPAEFADWVIRALGPAVATSHFLGQSLVTVDGSHAEVETYFSSWSRTRREAGEVLGQSIGRYLDHFEERGGEWRILNRKVILDIVHASPFGSAPGAPVDGRHGADDPSYAELPLLSAGGAR